LLNIICNEHFKAFKETKTSFAKRSKEGNGVSLPKSSCKIIKYLLKNGVLKQKFKTSPGVLFFI
jgi:hypothetical protein